MVALLPACDDGVLHAFEPQAVVVVGLGGAGSAGESGRGNGGKTSASDAETGGADGGTPDASSGETSGGHGGAPDGGDSSAGAAGATSTRLVDDFEDGDMRAIGPLGWWYPVNDGTAAQGTGIEPIGGDGTNIYALRTYGSGFSDWGAGLGVNLAGESTPLNALGYERLCFSARVETGSSSWIEVHLLQDPGVPYEHDVSLSKTWTRYCLPLHDFVAADRSELMPDKLIALQFFFLPISRFELYLDDVELEP